MKNQFKKIWDNDTVKKLGLSDSPTIGDLRVTKGETNRVKEHVRIQPTG